MLSKQLKQVNHAQKPQQAFVHNMDELLSRMRMSEQELELYKQQLNLLPEDWANLRKLEHFFKDKTLAFVNGFYKAIMSIPLAQKLLADSEALNSLKIKQVRYFQELIKADINLDYVKNRQRVGVVHQKIGLTPRLYLAAYSQYIESLIPHIHAFSQENPEEFVANIISFLKVVFFDISLAIDSHHEVDLLEKDNLHLRKEENDRHFRQLLENNNDWLWEVDKEGFYTYASPSVAKLVGYGVKDIIGHSIMDLMSSIQAKTGEQNLSIIFIKQQPFSSFCATLLHNDGHELIVESSGLPLLSDTGEFIGFRGITRNVTQRVTQELTDKKLSQALEQTADIVMICDCRGTIEYVNQAFENTTGYTRKEVIGKTPSLLKSGLQNKEIYHKLWTTLANGQVFSEVIINRKKDKSLYYEEKTITPLQDTVTAKVTHFISTGKDITKRIDSENRLYYLMHNNVLSGLPNYTFLKEKLDQLLEKAVDGKDKIAIFKLDLNRFKVINDSLGYEVGDMVLRQVASRLKQVVNHNSILAHPGSDKFVIIHHGLNDFDSIPESVEKILAVFESTFIVEEHELYLDAKVGISTYPGDGDMALELLRNAETAMNRAKEASNVAWHFYTADMNAVAHKRLTLESELRNAIKNEEFVVHYQPQICFNEKRIIGFEALLRWNHPEKGLVSPMEFIPVLEETKLIIEVGEWVLRAACKMNAFWRSMQLPEVTIAVNFSAVQFLQDGLVETITTILKETGLPPQALDVEITESIMMQDSEGVLAILHQLQTLGVQLSMDDFGTGYSSLSQLKKIPINTLKLDQSFVRGLPDDSGDKGITRAIISMGHNLGMNVLAEGVETEAQSSFLAAEGCDSMQGYLFSKAVDVEEATKILRQI